MQTNRLYIESIGASSPVEGHPENLERINGFDAIFGSADDRGTAASYCTIVCGTVNDGETARRCSRALADILCRMIPSSARRILVAGLGNPKISADALGCRTVELVLTKEKSLPAVFAVTPGIPSGLTSAETVAMFASRLSADLIIAVDSLASRSPMRVASLIQVSDAGISPGSGVSDSSRVIDAESMGRAVISVGVPTVISAEDLVENGEENGTAELYAPIGIDRTVDLFAAAVAGGINLLASRLS